MSRNQQENKIGALRTGGVLVGLPWVRIAFLVIAVFATPATAEGVNPGETLARRYCAVCHPLPTPDLLDKRTWREGALPLMFGRLGLGKLDTNGNPGAVRVLAEWRQICDYYLGLAPEVMPRPSNPLPITVESRRFQVRDPHYRPGMPAVTLTQVDASSHQIYVGNGGSSTLDVLDSQGRLLSSLPVNSPPVSLIHQGDAWYLTLIGSIFPSEDATGELWQLRKDEHGFTKVATLLDHLPRPTHVSCADLNGDGQDDFVVSAFGNRIGRFSWYENVGGKWTEHVLLDRPGAVKSYVTDFNHDGRPDITVMMAQGQEGIFMFANQGGGVFAQKPIITHHPLWGSASFELVDFFGGGSTEILTANGDNGEYPSCLKPYHGIRIFREESPGRWGQRLFLPLDGAYGVKPLGRGDPTHHPLVAISFFPDYEHSPEQSFVYLEDSGNFSYKAYSFPDSARGRWLTMDTGDLDGDGIPEVVLGAFNRTPFKVPESVASQWKTNGTSLLIVKPNPRTPPAKPDGN
jgi:hypothetical protein